MNTFTQKISHIVSLKKIASFAVAMAFVFSVLVPQEILAANFTITSPTSGASVSIDASGNAYMVFQNGNIYKVANGASTATVLATTVTGGAVTDSAIDPTGTYLYVTGVFTNNITRVNTTTGAASVIISSGLNQPYGVAVDSSGNIYVVNQGNATVAKYNSSGGSLGSWSTGSTPYRVAADNSGNIYVANHGGNSVTRVIGGTVSTLTGFSSPIGIVYDPVSDSVFVTNAGTTQVRKISSPTVTTPTVTTFGSTGTWPYSISVDSSGNVYTANNSGASITRIPASGAAGTTISTSSTSIDVGATPSGVIFSVSQTPAYFHRLVPPTVALSYSAISGGRVKAGSQTITATYSEAVSSAPTISINQPGTTDITNAAMSGSGTTYTYTYTVQPANGSTYLDGLTTVTLGSTVASSGGMPSNTATNNTFTIDTVAPTSTATYSASRIKAGSTTTITATLSEAVSGTPTISINQPGTTDITNAAMSGSGLSWSYTYTAQAATGSTYIDGTATVSFGGADIAGNTIVAPTSNSFIIDTTGPTATMAYTRSPIGVGTQRITALFNELPTAAPTISINQPGTTDISNASMSAPVGAAWTSLASPTGVPNPTAVEYGNVGSYCTSGACMTNGHFVVANANYVNSSSTNGASWGTALYTALTADHSFIYGSTNGTTPSSGNGIFVMLSNAAGDPIMTSTNATSWSTVSAGSISGTNTSWIDGVYGVGTAGGRFVAVSTTGAILTSTNGTTFTVTTPHAGMSWKAVSFGQDASGNPLFLAVGAQGSMSSSDGTTWSAVSTNATNFVSVAAGTDKYGTPNFVGVIPNGVIKITTDKGVTWSNATTVPAIDWKSVKSNGRGAFIAIPGSQAAANSMIKSVDGGLTWTAVTLPSGFDYQAMTDHNAFFNEADGSFYNLGGYSLAFAKTSGHYHYDYTVVKQTTSPDLSYQDGFATVSISSVSDGLGNTSSATPSNNQFQILTMGPIVTISAPSAAYAKTGDSITYTVSYSGATSVSLSNANVTLNTTGTANASSVVVSGSGTTTRTVTVSGLSGEGTLSISLAAGTAADVAGTGSDAAGPSAVFTVDNTAPVSTIVSPSTATYANTSTVALSGTGSDTNISSTTISVDGGAFVSTGGSAASWTYSATGLSNSAHTFQTKTTDAAGNTGLSAVVTVTVDTVAPTASLAYSLNRPVKNGDVQVITATFSEAMAVSPVPKIALSAITGGSALVATDMTRVSATQYTYSYTVGSGNGTPTATLSVGTDLAANVVTGAPTSGATFPFAVDNTAPTVSVSTTTTAGSYKAGVSIPITITFSEAVTTVGTTTVNFDTTGSCTFNAITTSTGATCNYIVGVGQSTSSLSVTGVIGDIKDASLNALTPTTPITNLTSGIVIDTAAPTLTTVTLASSNANTAMAKTGDTITLTITANETIGTPTVAFKTGTVAVAGSVSYVNTTGTTWTAQYTTQSGDTQGAVTFTVDFSDTALNAGTTVTTVTSGSGVTFDKTKPSSTIDAICSTAGNGCTIAGAAAGPQQAYRVVAITGTAADTGGSSLAGAKVSIQDTTAGTWYTGTAFGGASESYITATGTSTWSYDFSAVPLIIDHTYQINVKAFDGASNEESPVQTISFVATNSPPTISNVTASEDATGVVSISYDTTDAESSTTTNSLFYGVGATLVGTINSSVTSLTVSSATNLPTTGIVLLDDEMISYTGKTGNTLTGLTRGASIGGLYTTAFSHTGSTIYVYATSATGTGIGNSAVGTGKTISWTARSDADGYESATATIKVVANDGSPGSMIGSGVSGAFILDAAKPTGTATSLLINGSSTTVESAVSDVTLSLQNITGQPSTETIYVQFSRDGATWYGANANGTLASSGALGSGFAATSASSITWPWTVASRSENIQVKITDTYANTSVVDDNTVAYNATPEFDTSFGTNGISVVQVLDSEDPHFGQVKIDYKIRDTDNTTVTPTFSYDAAGGTNFTTIDQAQISGISTAITSTYTVHTVYWTPTAEAFSTTTANFKILIDDAEPITNTASQTISPIIIDTTKPAIATAVTFDAGAAGVVDSAIITIPKPTDASAVLYRIQDTASNSTPVDTGWVALSASTTIPWTFDADVEAKSITYQFKDVYGNITSVVTTSTLDPILASSFLIQDTSNSSIPSYDMYIGWKSVDDPAFSSYKLEFATSTDNSSYGAYSIVGSGLSNPVTNYYVHRNLDSTKYYRYRLGVVSTNGNTSIRAGAFTTAKPDGVQNFGEGGGGSVATASQIENIVPTQNEDKSVTVTYLFTDSSSAKKVTPTYEARVFYNTGITLPANAYSGGNLTVSNASKMPTSGFIQVNNEVIQYSGKTGNTLTGLTRGTWPTAPRATRQNLTFFAGTPVWVMAVSTTPTDIVDTTIVSGQTGSIAWSTYAEASLAGSSYTNVGIKVLVHDNQDAGSGPLSSHNDLSETGILTALDLTAPTVGFATTSGSGLESVTSVPITVSLNRAYPLATTVAYAVSGTAVGGGVDYTLANGTVTISAGQTSADITATITNQNVQRKNKTLVITLSSPTNATLSANTVYTYTIINHGSDTTAPVVSIVGSTPMRVLSGSVFTDPGATATDDIDGDLTSAIVVTGLPNTAVFSATPYTVTYTATDESGNVGTATRDVYVDDAAAVTYNITATAGANGTISPSGVTAVTVGTDQVYTITPDSGYKVESITIDSNPPYLPTSGVNTYTFTDVRSTHTIAATFVALPVTGDTTAPVITLNGSNPMSITKDEAFTDPGATALDAVDGVRTVTVTGSVVNSVVGTYTITYSATDVTGNISIATRTVNVVLANTYDITATAGANGTISPVGVSSLTAGANQTYTITPSDGYSIATLVVDGQSIAPVTTYTFSNITRAHTIAVTFGITPDTTAPVITLTGETPMEVTLGESFTDPGATATDDRDVTVTVTTTGTVNTAAIGSYTITYSAQDVAGNVATPVTRTVNVVYAATYTITATAGANGTISPLGATAVPATTNQVYTITPDAGYSVDTLTIDGIRFASATTYTFTSVIAAHTIAVTFSTTPDITAPTITLTGETPMSVTLGGSFTDPGATATDDIDTTVTVTTTGTVNTSAIGTYTLTYSAQDAAGNVATPVTRTVTVGYAATYPITATAGANGSISPSGTTDVTAQSNQTYTITPDAGYEVLALTVDGQSLTVAETYTFSNVVSAHTIAVTFKPQNSSVPPVITILGDNPMLVTSGTVFVDPGATAVDAVTSASLDVTAVGTVNTAIAGTYKITYFASDSLGNSGTAERTVTVSDATPPVISVVQVPVITTTAAVITWQTDEPSTSQVIWGTSAGDLSRTTTLDSALSRYHMVALSAATTDIDGSDNTLTTETTYYFKVRSADAFSNTTELDTEQTFATTAIVTQTLTAPVTTVTGTGINNTEPDIIAPKISNVEVKDVTPFSATVTFTTDEDTIAFAEFGKDTQYGNSMGSSKYQTEHSIKLIGLRLGSEYHVRVNAVDKNGNATTSEDKTFTTKFLSEDNPDLKTIDNIAQYQAEIEATLESILPSLIAPFIEKPTITEITENSATITYRTNIKAFPTVSYATDADYNKSPDKPYNVEVSDTSAKTLTHKIVLTGLKTNTKYHVMAKAFSLPQVVGKSNDIVFTTLPSKIRGAIVDRKKDSFSVVWTTEEPTTSIIDYKNTATGKSARIVDGARNTSHLVRVENLQPGTNYQVDISGVNAEGNLFEGSAPLFVKTSVDVVPPVITNIKVESALIVGRTDKVQTIVSWQTDEASTSTVYYEEGSGASDKPLANKQRDGELTRNHVVILTSLKPGTVYRFTVESVDDANNSAKPPVRTIITPKKTESIVDVIFKNFNETFNFVNNVK